MIRIHEQDAVALGRDAASPHRRAFADPPGLRENDEVGVGALPARGYSLTFRPGCHRRPR